MKNDWKKIWEARSLEKNIQDFSNYKELFIELKRCNGFDTGGGEISGDALMVQYETIKKSLFKDATFKINSIYEVGCGSGANLYLFEREGFICGGIDYSEAQINIAKQVLKTKDLLCDEAINCDEHQIYDCVLSNSVVSYFTDLNYAREVLKKMCHKSRYSIGLIDVYDAEKESDFIAYRKKAVEDYEVRYANLPKLFYSKSFFEDFAKENNLRVEFAASTVENYWNNDFIFNCFMYK